MTLDLFTPGAYCRAVGGNLERPDIQAPVVRWLAWSINPDNGAGGAVRPWDTCRRLWSLAGLASFPWLHVHSLEDVDRLVDVGLAEHSPAIGLNLEDARTDFLDKGHTLADVAARLEDWSRPVHMATLGWVQNGAGWEALARVVAALEVNPDEAPAIAEDVPGCVAHAFAEGLVNVTLMYGTKAPNAPEDYDLGVCHSLYTADDITPTADAWRLWEAPAGPCARLEPMPPATWYEKPYATGPPVGPDTLPRPLYPPKSGKGTQAGDDVIAYKRAISRGGRLLPWSPSTWSPAYGDAFAMGDGSGQVGKSGVRGFQRQTFPDDTSKHTGNLGDATYQALRRARVSDPESVNFGEPLFDARAVALLVKAAAEFRQGEPAARFRVAVSDFCNRAEHAASALWTYDMSRAFRGFGVEPEKAHRADCSAYAILSWFWGRQQSGLLVPDPSDFNWSGFGSTRELDDNPTVTSGNYLVADLALYSAGTGHVTICKRSGDAATSRWSSFGGEPRPVERTLRYRPDFVKVVRPPLE